MNPEPIMPLAKMWFNFWLNNPEKEDWMFNKIEILLNIMEYTYGKLVGNKILIPIEKLDEKIKHELKNEVLRICPTRDVKKGMMIAKSIYVFGFLSNE